MIWREYIVLANDLVAYDADAWKRSAVSRAYYGAFNPARRWLEENVGPVGNRAVHQRVWDAFRAPDRATEATRAKWEFIGEVGGKLRVLRNQADYDDDMADLTVDAPQAVVDAKLILALLAELELASG